MKEINQNTHLVCQFSHTYTHRDSEEKVSGDRAEPRIIQTALIDWLRQVFIKDEFPKYRI